METAINILSNVSLVLFIGLTASCFHQWKTRDLPALRWAGMAFGTLATIGVIGLWLQDPKMEGATIWFVKGLVVILMMFPYLLYRFATEYQKPHPKVAVAVRILTLTVVVWTLAIPTFPMRGAVSPGWWWDGFRTAFLAQWTLLFSVVAIQLWGAATDQATVPRRRMRTLALAAVGMNIALLAGGGGSIAEFGLVALLTKILSLGSASLFFIGLAPPGWLQVLWRDKENRNFQAAMGDLFRAQTQAEASAILLPHAAGILGARGAVLVSPFGELLASHGSVGSKEEIVALISSPVEVRCSGVHRVPVRTGYMLLWTSPHAPFFGRDELQMMDAWGSFVDLAMERCALADQQRTFIANAAHELRTPLTTILGVSSTLANRGPELSPAQTKECVDALDRQGARAVSLIANLLDLAQLDSGRMTTAIAPVGLARIARRALRAAPPPINKTVKIDIAEDSMASADPERLEQILVNLLENAYLYGGSEIKIEAREGPEGVVLTVCDQGPGVPLELVPHLFEPFTRAPGHKSPGSGLGLALSKRLAEAFGGTMWYSAGVPEGASFELRLPKAA